MRPPRPFTFGRLLGNLLVLAVLAVAIPPLWDRYWSGEPNLTCTALPWLALMFQVLPLGLGALAAAAWAMSGFRNRLALATLAVAAVLFALPDPVALVLSPRCA